MSGEMGQPDLMLTMPLPPSTNALWIRAAGIPRACSPAYKAWQAEAGWIVRQQMIGAPLLRCTFAAEVRVPVRSMRDRNNHDKAIFDLLESCGVVLNDSGLRDYTVKGEQRDDVLVMLWDQGGPEQRQPGPRGRRQGVASAAAVVGGRVRVSPSQVARWRRAGVLA